MSEEKLTRAAVVTGGSRGIGRAVCVALAKQGCNVVVNYCHGEAAAAETAALCKELGVEAVTVDRKSTRLNSSHSQQSRMPSSA